MPEALVNAPGSIPRPERTPPTRLRVLAQRPTAASHHHPVGILVGGDVAVTGVTAASAQVRPGDLFAALPGGAVHGASFATEAIGRGAVAVLTDVAGRELVPEGTPMIVVQDVRAVLGRVSSAVYGDPSAHLPVLGVTGTSGKTTTTFLMRAGLQAAGRNPGLMGTVATLVGDEQINTGFTTPEAPEVQALLAAMRERGVTDVVMEVSSHALAMGRVDGIGFAASGFTNLSEDHLDFHEDMTAYFAAKARLFEEHRTRRPVVVVDDGWGNRLIETLAGGRPPATVDTTGSRAATDSTGSRAATDSTGAAWYARDIADRPDGSTSFQVLGPGVQLRTGCAIPGRYNVANALLALAMLHEGGVAAEVAAPAIATATVPGRMERVEAGQPFLAVVDYSHKPAAVDGALRALRPLTRGRLIIVLGCGGDRDRVKRPLMGELAARGADLLIVTDDNPRSERPADIRRAMLAGALAVPAAERGEVREIGERAEAIAAAVAQAGPGDTVLVAGKGHETGQQVGGVLHPFDDRDVLRAALRELPT